MSRRVTSFNDPVPGMSHRQVKDFPFVMCSRINDSPADRDLDFPVEVNDWLRDRRLAEAVDYLWLFFSDKSVFCFADGETAMMFKLRFG